MATIPVTSNQDLNNNQILNVRLQMLSSAPSALEAKIYYDTTLHKFGYHNGTEWVYDTEITYATVVSALGYTPVNNTVAINGYSLMEDITLTASDVGALPDSTVIPTVNNPTITIQKNGTTVESFTLNQSTAETINITVPTQASDVNAVPTSRTVNGKALSSDITLSASDVGALSDSTTINDLTTSTQQDALNSGATSTNIGQIATNTSAISTINGKIPSAASTSNQLADKAYVTDLVQTNSAHFRGNWATWAAVPTSTTDYPADDDGNKTPTVNDYLVVQDASDYTDDTLTGAWQFTYTGTWATNGKAGWLPRFQINENPLTPSQQAALDSGITSTLVTQIGTNQSDISTINGQITTINTTLASKTGKFTATNPALTQSGGVCSWSVTNSFATADVNVIVYRVSDGVQVMTEVDVSNSTIVIKFNSTSNISAGTYKVVVIG